MRGLAAILALGLIGFMVPAFAEPDVWEDGSVVTAILLTPEFEVDTSEFGSTGEIILDVKFENKGNLWVGLHKVIEPSYDGLDDPVEVYEKYADERRFYIYILDENGEKLDIESMTVASDDEFILPHGTTEMYDDRYVVEILDIDELVTFTGAKAKLETQLKLSSPELVTGNDYELNLFTVTRIGTEPLPFTLPTIQETSTPAPMEMPKDPEEAQILEDNKAETKEIPEWVKDIFKFYADGSIGDVELIGALQYLIKNGIIEV